jgi:hypothetical protein
MLKVSQKRALLIVKAMYATQQYVSTTTATLVSNPAELLNSMAQIKSHGLLSNSIQQLLNSTNP